MPVNLRFSGDFSKDEQGRSVSQGDKGRHAVLQGRDRNPQIESMERVEA